MAEGNEPTDVVEWFKENWLYVVGGLFAVWIGVVWLGTGKLDLSPWDAKWPTTTTTTRSPSLVIPARPTATCNPNYTGCVPDVPYDIDCDQVVGPVGVIGVDVYWLDGDFDGIGCEWG